jgi:hypothetical protein
LRSIRTSILFRRSPNEQVEVHVVNVDVSVTDRSGNPVNGLTKHDFEIFEDGKPLKVTNFSVFSSVGPTSPAAAAVDRGAPRRTRRSCWTRPPRSGNAPGDDVGIVARDGKSQDDVGGVIDARCRRGLSTSGA